MSAKDIIYSRKSTRNFLEKQVPKEDLMEIIETAGRAPSWTNSQPWEVFVVSGEKLNKLREIWKKEMDLLVSTGNMKFDRTDIAFPGYDDWNDAPRAVENMVKFKKELSEQTGLSDAEQSKILGEANSTFLNAPTVVFLGINKTLGPYSMYDLGAYQQTLLLAAEEKNIDSCPAGSFVVFGDILREELDIPNNVSIATGVALGYGDKDFVLNKRDSMIRMELDQYARFYE